MSSNVLPKLAGYKIRVAKRNNETAVLSPFLLLGSLWASQKDYYIPLVISHKGWALNMEHTPKKTHACEVQESEKEKILDFYFFSCSLQLLAQAALFLGHSFIYEYPIYAIPL
jgi:hypothetical protein